MWTYWWNYMGLINNLYQLIESYSCSETFMFVCQQWPKPLLTDHDKRGNKNTWPIGYYYNLPPSTKLT
jgi:hypothetical protein